MPEYVVLVDDHDMQIGTMLKSDVHSAQTPLHRAFSCFVFTSDGRILLQQRATSKKTWPGVWSNSCCGHPLPDESYTDAVCRRVGYELGIDVQPTHIVKIHDYRYCFVRYGVMEHEICPIFATIHDAIPVINPDEVASIVYRDWYTWLEELRHDAPGDQGVWSEWCKQEAPLVDHRYRAQQW